MRGPQPGAPELPPLADAQRQELRPHLRDCLLPGGTLPRDRPHQHRHCCPGLHHTHGVLPGPLQGQPVRPHPHQALRGRQPHPAEGPRALQRLQRTRPEGGDAGDAAVAAGGHHEPVDSATDDCHAQLPGAACEHGQLLPRPGCRWHQASAGERARHGAALPLLLPDGHPHGLRPRGRHHPGDGAQQQGIRHVRARHRQDRNRPQQPPRACLLQGALRLPQAPARVQEEPPLGHQA
mmetsp:Transcript_5129/g.19021  ORF Transcript_5129/g.19021 Transcript_5129/m.19021 type:complete len:236 (-) Transcript_5129:3349-4056(-)